MATGEALITWLVVLVITSSVTCVYHVQAPDDVSHDANILSRVMPQWRQHGVTKDAMARRTPGWGKRPHLLLPALSPGAATFKRRGWGKRDVVSNCGYWLSLLQFIEVRTCRALVPHTFLTLSLKFE